MGDLYKLNIGHYGISMKSEWNLERVIIQSEKGGKWEFVCNQLLDANCSIYIFEKDIEQKEEKKVENKYYNLVKISTQKSDDLQPKYTQIKSQPESNSNALNSLQLQYNELKTNYDKCNAQLSDLQSNYNELKINHGKCSVQLSELQSNNTILVNQYEKALQGI